MGQVYSIDAQGRLICFMLIYINFEIALYPSMTHNIDWALTSILMIKKNLTQFCP